MTDFRLRLGLLFLQVETREPETPPRFAAAAVVIHHRRRRGEQ
ncbi:unnamed protein product [Arabidopsis lyrata]|nr:unnamed protein product [Arabidopsis lyrata]